MTEQITITVTKSFVISGMPKMTIDEQRDFVDVFSQNVIVDLDEVTLPSGAEFVESVVVDDTWVIAPEVSNA